MPRINRLGQIAVGLGTNWYDDVRTMRQRQTSPTIWQIWTRLGDTWDRPIYTKHGCNFSAASQQHWIASLGGSPFGSQPIEPTYRLPAGLDGRGNAAMDGTIALARTSDNIGLVLKRADGSEKHEPDAHLDSRICVLDRETALWIDTRDGKPRTIGTLPVPLALPGPIPFVAGVVFDRQHQPWWVYHSSDAIGLVLQPFDSFIGYRLSPAPAFYPHALTLADGRTRVTWALDPAEASVQAPFIEWEAPRIDLRSLLIPTQPKPDPDPEPEPQPEPVTMKIPASVQASIRRFVDTFPVPSGLPPGDAAKEAMRPYMRRIAEQVAFDVSLNYGCKSTSSGAQQSPDALAQPRAGGNGLLWIWDIFTSTGTGNPKLNLDADAEPDHLSNQHFIPVTASDHVGSGSQPGNGGTQPQPGGITKAELDIALDKLRRAIGADVDELANRVKALEDKPVPTPTLPANLARKGDTVKVTGKVSVADVARSREVTWTGTIQGEE